MAHAGNLAQELGPEALVLVNLSGRGDKDVDSVSRVIDAEEGAEVGV